MDEERREAEQSEPAGSARGAVPEERDAEMKQDGLAMEESAQPSVPAILKRPRVLALIGALVILVIVLITACGGGDDEATSVDDPSTVDLVDTTDELPPEPEPTAEPLEPEPAAEPPPVAPAELPIVKVKGKALKRGMSNKRVMALQEALIYLGYLEEGSADGKFGQKTKKAVQEFQLEQGLNGDGVAGRKTIRSVNKAVKAAPAGGAALDDAAASDEEAAGAEPAEGSGDGTG